jgi:hypothetical protein
MTIERSVRMALAVGVLAGVAGCQVLPGTAQRDAAEQMIAGTGCNPGQNVCRVEVRVVDCRRRDGFVVTPDDLTVRERSLIVWDIVTEGYRFTPAGIDVKRNDGVFERPRPVGNGKRYAWHDKHNTHRFYKPETYDYAIGVVHEGGSVQCRTFDPRISNR